MSTALHSEASSIRREQPGKRLRPPRAALFYRRFCHGFLGAVGAFRQNRLAINDASLGMLLLSLGIGSLLAMPFSGWLTGKLGCRTVILLAGALLCLVLPMLTQADRLPLMAIVLLFSARPSA